MQDYFSFYGLPVSPVVDQQALRKKYYALSRELHPDFHTLKGASEQQATLEKASYNNEAYQVLSDPDRRLKYFLDLKGALAEEGQNQVPQDFLMEMMEVNEALMELEFDNDPSVRQKITGLVDQLEAGLEEDAAGILANYDDDTATDAQLSVLRDYYLKRRYLLRIRQNLDNFAGPQ